MSAHIGVSCDSCLRSDFSNRRYKCLTCDNYDLCGTCYDENSESDNHLNTHPIQCILTKTAHDLFYTGESISYHTIVSLTCPYCGVFGFIPHTLLIHCPENHSLISLDRKINPVAVLCPICVLNPLEGNQSRFVSLADHIAREHHGINSSSQERKEDLEQDEDEDSALYILAERLFHKAEKPHQRRVPRITTGSFPLSSDPYTTMLFSQDSLIDYQALSADSITLASFFLPPSDSSVDHRLLPKKHFEDIQHPMYTHRLPQETSRDDRNLIPEPNLKPKPSTKSPENHPRSLLGKILKSDQSTRLLSNEKHLTFTHSLLFSSLNISRNKEQLL